MKVINLIPPSLNESNIKQRITCIRAHRERIFNVSPQILGEKLIVHNYGQGGAGWTFLFGCVYEAIRLFEHNKPSKKTLLAVIGAGCYGLLTAIILARKGYKVRIIAKETEGLPSAQAAGFFFPRPRKSSTPDERALFENYGIESYKTYLQIMNGQHPYIGAGAQLLPAYYGSDIDPGFGPYLSNKLMPKPEQVNIDFGNGKRYDAIRHQQVFIHTSTLMQELNRNAIDLDIPIIKEEIAQFNDIPEPIIFHCAGLGARMLTCDSRLIPVQGHLITLQNQPRLDQLQYMINVKVVQKTPLGRLRDELIYFAPKNEGILGITFIRGQDNRNANQHEFDRLLERSRDFFGTDI